MNTRSIVHRAVVIVAMTVGLWIVGASVPNAQYEGEISPPPECFDESGEIGPCELATLFFAPGAETQIAFFTNNSMEITTDVFEPFFIRVWLMPHSVAKFKERVAGTPFADFACNPSGPSPSSVDTSSSVPAFNECAVIRVDADNSTVARASYGEFVDFIQGWVTPPITGDTDDYHLLRAPGQQFFGDPKTFKFTQDITTRVCPGYIPGVVGCDAPPETDDGVGGRTDGFSDYVVAIDNGDDDDFDDDDRRDDVDDDDDNDGKHDHFDDDDDNDGKKDHEDDDDDNDRIDDSFDSESTKEKQRALDNDVNGWNENSYDMIADSSTLLLTATAEAFQLDLLNQWLRVEIWAPNGTLLAVSPRTPGRTVAAAVPALPGTYRVKVKNLSGGRLSYRTLLITTRNWLPGELLR